MRLSFLVLPRNQWQRFAAARLHKTVHYFVEQIPENLNIRFSVENEIVLGAGRPRGNVIQLWRARRWVGS